jgi:hypothetical protein
MGGDIATVESAGRSIRHADRQGVETWIKPQFNAYVMFRFSFGWVMYWRAGYLCREDPDLQTVVARCLRY